MNLIEILTDTLTRFSMLVPLPWFTFMGALVEEVIAPIPSPLVMTLTGSLAASMNSAWSYLIFLSLVGAVGKTIGSYLIYLFADKTEDFVIKKLGKFIGVSQKEVEIIGKHLNKGRMDDFVLLLLRAIPIIPTAPVSVVCGLIKLNIRTFVVSTFLGTFLRNIFYIYLGYAGLKSLDSINQELEGSEKYGYLLVLVLLVLGIIYFIYHKKKNTGIKFLERKSRLS